MTLVVRKSNLSGITPTNANQSGPNLADMHRLRDDNVQKILDAIGKVLAKSARAAFLYLQNDNHFIKFAMADFHHILPRHVNPRLLGDFQKGFSNIFHLGIIYPLPQNWKGSKRYLILTSLQPKDALQRAVYSMLKDQGVSDFRSIFVWRTLSLFPNFCIFAYVFPYKMPKTYLPVTSLYVVYMLPEPLIPYWSGRPWGWFLLVRFFCDIWWRSWIPPNLHKFSPMGNACV